MVMFKHVLKLVADTLLVLCLMQAKGELRIYQLMLASVICKLTAQV